MEYHAFPISIISKVYLHYKWITEPNYKASVVREEKNVGNTLNKTNSISKALLDFDYKFGLFSSLGRGISWTVFWIGTLTYIHNNSIRSHRLQENVMTS